MHVLLKAWMKLRWCLLEQWQESFASQGWWDSCGPGHSCLDVAVRRLIQYESSQLVPEHRVTLYLDLSCFYETIIHARLAAHAQEVGFPPLLLWGALALASFLPMALWALQPTPVGVCWLVAPLRSLSARSPCGRRATQC